MQISDKQRNIAAAVILIAAAVFIVIGITRGEPVAVMRKAIVMCMECIGLG